MRGLFIFLLGRRKENSMAVSNVWRTVVDSVSVLCWD